MQLGFLTAPQLAGLTADDRLVEPFLKPYGIELLPVVWTEKLPAGLDALIMRSTWGYFQQPLAFESWLQGLRQLDLPIQNSPQTMLNNLDKRYLLDLQQRGYPVVPTRYLADGQDYRLIDDWPERIIKPVVSASGFETHRLRRGQPLPASLLELRRGLLVQPFCEAIQSEGEWSLIFFAGHFSHAVLKQPAAQGHLVQEEHGGSTQLATPPPELLTLGLQLMASGYDACLYARVDCVRYQGRYHLMELELLEPSLYLAYEPNAPARWAQAILSWLRLT